MRIISSCRIKFLPVWKYCDLLWKDFTCWAVISSHDFLRNFWAIKNVPWVQNLRSPAPAPESRWGSGQTYGSLGPQFPTQASLMAQRVKNLPAVQETQVWFLGWEDPLEKGVATHSSILAWRIPLTKEPCGLQFIGSRRVRRNWATNTRLTKSTPIINGLTSSQDGPTSKQLTHGNFEWWASEINHSFL